jgi:hypothetical protein
MLSFHGSTVSNNNHSTPHTECFRLHIRSKNLSVQNTFNYFVFCLHLAFELMRWLRSSLVVFRRESIVQSPNKFQFLCIPSLVFIIKQHFGSTENEKFDTERTTRVSWKSMAKVRLYNLDFKVVRFPCVQLTAARICYRSLLI